MTYQNVFEATFKLRKTRACRRLRQYFFHGLRNDLQLPRIFHFEVVFDGTDDNPAHGRENQRRCHSKEQRDTER